MAEQQTPYRTTYGEPFIIFRRLKSAYSCRIRIHKQEAQLLRIICRLTNTTEIHAENQIVSG